MPSLRSTDGLTSPTLLASAAALLCSLAFVVPGVAQRIQRPTQDAAAKRRVAAAASQLERCRIELRAPGDCVADGGLQVVDAGASGYWLQARSGSGTSFAILRRPADAPPRRTCTPPDQGGCRADGTW